MVRTNPTARPNRIRERRLRLWHNLGNGKFEDATRKAGLYDPTSKGLGVAILDTNNDGWPDILIANDTQPNKLYVNKKNGTFEERAVSAGIAFSEDGIARAGMGVDAADYDRSGSASLIITNFSNQMLSLYHNEGNGLFVDEAPRSEVGRATLLTLGFGCFFFDYDNDGWQDIFVADGHIEDQIETRAEARQLRRAAAPVPQSGQRQVRGSNQQSVGQAPLPLRKSRAAPPTPTSTTMESSTCSSRPTAARRISISIKAARIKACASNSSGQNRTATASALSSA